MLRTERVALMLSHAEKEALGSIAEAEGGLSQSALLRRLIHHAARERGIWPPAMQARFEMQAEEVQRDR